MVMEIAKKHQGSTVETITLEVPAEFNFDHCLKFLNRSTKECLHRVNGNRWIKLLKLGGQLVLINVYAVENQLCIDLQVSLNSSQKQQLIEYLEQVFDLKRDLAQFYRAMAQDPIMSPLVDSYYGLRLIGIPELFEALCWSVIGQQINLSFAYDLKRRLVEEIGEKLSVDQKDYYLFPSPSAVASLNPEDFVPWKFSAAKAKYLIAVAQEMVNGGLTKEELLQMSFQQAFTRLTSIKGIGPWSANYVLMKCLGQPAAFPSTDVGLQNAVKNLWALDRKPSMDELEELRTQWSPWEGYATFYLWHSLIA